MHLGRGIFGSRRTDAYSLAEMDVFYTDVCPPPRCRALGCFVMPASRVPIRHVSAGWKVSRYLGRWFVRAGLLQSREAWVLDVFSTFIFQVHTFMVLNRCLYVCACYAMLPIPMLFMLVSKTSLSLSLCGRLEAMPLHGNNTHHLFPTFSSVT